MKSNHYLIALVLPAMFGCAQSPQQASAPASVGTGRS